MVSNRSLWLPLLVVICVMVMLYGGYRSITSDSKGPANLDCGGSIADRPAGCFH